MRTSHKKRLARLVAALDESESEAIDRRCTLRFYAYVCEDIREAMEWRGIDPACSRPLLAMEAKLAGFVDTPELRDTDGAYCAAKQAEALAEGDDPWGEAEDAVMLAGQRYLDGSRPDFRFASLLEIWPWALVQDRLLPAIPDGG
ncbi:MAG: hypothetical protein E6G81_07025 [Alphaproteobacteria bacterium]|nr:MAG: hypothetical protein E6G81_07025 [Alphaproteobacteria bacterium]